MNCISFASQPYTFGAILNRDEVYHSIMAHAVKLDLPWAASHRETSPSKRCVNTLMNSGYLLAIKVDSEVSVNVEKWLVFVLTAV